MAQRLFTGQYGPLSQVDTRPIVQAGQAWGQAIQGTLENVGKAIEKHQLNKQWEAAEPKLQAYADSLNLPPDQRDIILSSIKRDKDAMANGYTAITKAADLAMQQKGVQLAQQQIRQTMEANKRSADTEKFNNLVNIIASNASQGIMPDEDRLNTVNALGESLGYGTAAGETLANQKVEQLRQAREVADLTQRGKEADIEYKKGQTGATALQNSINQLKMIQSLRPEVKPFVDQLETAQKEYNAVVNSKSIPVKGYGTLSLADIKALEKEDEKKYKKVMKILQDPATNAEYLKAVAAEKEMTRRNQGLIGGINVYVDTSQPEPTPEPTPKPTPEPAPPVTLDSPMTPTNIIKLGTQALPARKPFATPPEKKLGKDPLFDIGMYGGM